jgi:hypothetical protein
MNMKFRFFTFALLLASALTASAQRVKPPQNVLEYFNALPTKYLGIVKDIGDRRQTVEIQDIENGYLKLSSNRWEGWGEVALFKNTDGTKTLGIQTIGCGPGCETESIFFVQYRNGRWIDVTKEVLPEISEAERRRVLQCYKPDNEDPVSAYYELPRFGTTIKLIDNNEAEENGSLLYEFDWNGSKFVARATRDRACKEQ